jgi:hypothetical protein
LGFYGSAEVPLEEPTFEHVPDALDVIDGPRGLFIFNSWMSLAGHSEYHEKMWRKKLEKPGKKPDLDLERFFSRI